jgi:hypothetical protein
MIRRFRAWLTRRSPYRDEHGQQWLDGDGYLVRFR